MFIETWNLLKHFSLTNINADSLNNALEKGLKAVAVSNSKIDFRNILQDLLDISEDIRARVWFNDDNSQKYSLPFIIEKIDDRFFVASGNLDRNDIDFYELTQNKINFGDEIIEINGKTTEELFGNKITKSNKKWKNIREVMLYRVGEENSSLKFKLKRNDGEIFEQTLVRNIKSNFVTRQKTNPIVKIDPNTIYLNFSYMDDKYINSYIDTLATYKNFIIDLRGDIIVSEAFISLILDKHFESSQICLPFFAKPNKELMTYYKQSGVYAPVETKKLDGKFIFLTDWQTSGNSELFASVVKDTKVGKIVGQATQGALVSSITIRLDADFSISLGTVYGYSPKGKALLNAPIEPDIPVKTTVEDLKNNIDPIFEAAIKALK
jgi:C-terminal processing protease CtpA/Prc